MGTTCKTHPMHTWRMQLGELMALLLTKGKVLALIRDSRL